MSSVAQDGASYRENNPDDVIDWSSDMEIWSSNNVSYVTGGRGYKRY